MKTIEETIHDLMACPIGTEHEILREWAKSIITKCWEKSRIVIHEEYGEAVRHDEQALITEEYVGKWVSVNQYSIMDIKKKL